MMCPYISAEAISICAMRTQASCRAFMSSEENALLIYLRRCLVVFAASLLFAFGGALGHAQEPENEIGFQKELAADIGKWTADAACSRKLHVILVLGTTTTYQKSNASHAFMPAWTQDLLAHYFQPEDRFTLMAFGKNTVNVFPKPLDYTDSNIEDLQKAFENVTKISGKGTFVHMARRDGLKRAIEIAKADHDHAVLLLVVSVRQDTDGSGPEITKDHNDAMPDAQRLAKEFALDPKEMSSPTAFKIYPEDGDHTPSTLYIWHAFEKNWSGKPAAAPVRMIAINPERAPTPPIPPDHRAAYGALGALLFVICLLALLGLRSKVEVTFNNYPPQKITVPMWHKIPVYVSTERDGENLKEVVLPLKNASSAKELIGEIVVSGFSMALWESVAGYLALADFDSDVQTEVELPHEEVTKVKVWTNKDQPDAAGIISVKPASWWHSKTAALATSSLAFVLAMALFGVAAKSVPTPPVAPPVRTTEDACSAVGGNQ
jgi:hypothetical protein